MKLAFFEGDLVSGVNNVNGVHISYNNAGQIFMSSLGEAKYIIAICDNRGNIRKGDAAHGIVIAKCADGIVFEGSRPGGRILAYYDGDMYGAAAAAAITVLGLGGAQNTKMSKQQKGLALSVFDSTL